MPRASARSVFLLGLALLGGEPARAQPEAPIVEGSSVARYAGSLDLDIPSYRNSGFTQSVDGRSLEVEVRVAAGWSRAPFVPPREPVAMDAVGRFAVDAARRARTQVDAVSAVIHQVAKRVTYRNGRDLPERAEEVLARREASCVGLANLAVAALESLGLEARIVRGLLYTGDGSPPQPHRWIEVWYPDAGWTFSDATESVNYVSPRHVVVDLPAEPDASYSPGRVQRSAPALVEEHGALLAVDLRPDRPTALGERRSLPVQYGGAIRGRVLPARGGRVRLSGSGQARESEVGASGVFSFPGLVPGRYVLSGQFGVEEVSVTVALGSYELREVEVRLP